jgi:hypothetical protein
MSQNTVQKIGLWWSVTLLSFANRLAARKPEKTDDDQDRGDVPGWVMITVMTAIVVIALLIVFKEQVTTAVKNAFESVSGAGKN